MGWRTTSDLDRFVEVSAGYLRQRAAENTLLLAAAQSAWHSRAVAAAPADCDLLYGWWQPPDGSGPRGAFLHDPSAPLLIAGRAPELAAALAGTLAKAGRTVCGVDAPVAAADAFAAAWSQRSGAAVRPYRHSYVYRLASGDSAFAQLAEQAGPVVNGGQSGRLRVAEAADHALLAGGLAAFAAESGERIGSTEELADELISYGGAAFWEVPQRAARASDAAHFPTVPHHHDSAYSPVAMAAVTEPVAGTVRISILYTPPELRRQGYAGSLIVAVTYALLVGVDRVPVGQDRAPSRPAALPKADEVILITDMNRPERGVSRFGYQFIGERAVLRFGPQTGPLPKLRTGPMPRLPTGPMPRLPTGPLPRLPTGPLPRFRKGG
jgi:hypothetical protein